MDLKRSRLWLGSLLLICLLVQPVGVGAQCMTVSVVTGGGTQGGMNYMYAIKYLSGTYSCMFVMSMNAISCDPNPADTMATALTGSAYTGVGLTASCSWNCDCGTVTITEVDLPVELMGFEIEGEGE